MADTQVKGEKLSIKEAMAKLSELRAGRGGKKSKFESVIQDALDMKSGQVVRTEAEGYGDVSSLKSTLSNRSETIHDDEDRYTVRAERFDEDRGSGVDSSDARYHVFVFLTEDVES